MTTRGIALTDLPALRRATATGLIAHAATLSTRDDAAAASAFAELGGLRAASAELTRDARRLQAADLFWVTSAMSDLATAAARDLPEWTPASTIPTDIGLLAWQNALPPVPWQGAPGDAWTVSTFGIRTPPRVPVDAASWASHGGHVTVTLMTLTARIAQHVVSHHQRSIPLFGFATTRVAPRRADVIDILGATWLLMQQPLIADVIESREHDRSDQLPTRNDRAIRVVDLRRTATHHEPALPSGRQLLTRHIVRGHWRQQACGPGRALRRPTWIPPHIRGPDGAPFISGEIVRVWRR
jgi:hypothetical protein